MRHIHHRHKRPQKTHADIVEHFQMRCRERLGGTIIKQESLRRGVESKALICHGKQSCTKTWFEMPYWWLGLMGFKQANPNITYIAVYDKPRHGFVTVLLFDKDGNALVDEEEEN